MLNLVIKEANGDYEVIKVDSNMTITPTEGQQFYFDNYSGSNYTFNLVDGEKSIELIINASPTIKIVFTDMVDLINKSGNNPDSELKTVLSMIDNPTGLYDLQQTVMNTNFKGGEVIDALKELLAENTVNPDKADGIVIDDFGSLAEQIDAAAAGGSDGDGSYYSFDTLDPSGRSYSADGRGTGTAYTDQGNETDDPENRPADITLSGDTLVTEGDVASYTITLSRAASTEITITLTTGHITTEDGDYIPITQTITIPAGVTEYNFTVQTNEDYSYDSGEFYSVQMTNISGGGFNNLRVINDTVETQIIETDDKPIIIVGDAGTVLESGLDDSSDNSEIYEGSFSIESLDGISEITIAGVTFTISELEATNTTSSSPIDSGEGLLEITGFTDLNNGNFVVNFKYTLKDNLDHNAPNDENLFDSIPLSVVDTNGDIDNAEITIKIVDDTPELDVGLDENEMPSLTTQDADTIGLSSDSDSVSFANQFTLNQDMGADDTGTLGTLNYELSVTNPISGLKSDGEAISLLVNAAGEIEGTTLSGDIIFTVTVDENTGEVTLTQNAEIDHTDENSDGDATNNSVNNLGLLTGNVILTASATITDGDGDQVSDSQDLDISSALSFDDDVPTIEVTTDAEDGVILTTQDADTKGALGDTDTSTADFSGVFDVTFNYGADDVTGNAKPDISYNLQLATGILDGTDSGLDSEGNNVLLYVDAITGNVVGRYNDGTNDVDVFEISVDADGKVTLTQNEELDHGIVGSSTDTILSLSNGLVELKATSTITDDDGDAVTDSATVDLGGNIKFEDDVPTIEVTTDAEDGVILTTQDADTKGALGDTDTSTADFSGVFDVTFNYGADDVTGNAKPDISYNLQLATGVINGTDSGLDSEGNDVLLYVDTTTGNVIGRYNDGTNDVDVFEISVDADGKVTLTQNEVLDHLGETSDGDSYNNSENIVTLANGLVELKATSTITDDDGDKVTDSATVDLGGNIKFEDDVPVASVDDAAVTAAKLNNIELTVDESAGQQANPADNVSANSSSADFSSLFKAVAVTGGGTSADYGTDGAGSVSYELSLSNTTTNTSLVTLGSGLYALDTSDTVTTDGDGYGQGSEIVMSVNANGDIEGKVGNEVYFTLSTDDSGVVTFTQSKNIWNSDTSDNNDVESLVLAKLDNADVSILLTQIITDADGDKDSASVSLVSSDDSVDVAKFNILDDGPTASIPDVTLLEKNQFTITNHDSVSSAGYHNSYGYYIKDAITGEPTTGVIVWDDVHDNDTVPVTVTGYTEDQVGFFIIPNGENKNANLEDNTEVTFAKNASGQWEATTSTGTVIVGQGSPVLFDSEDLNVDQKNHVEDNTLIGNQNWEDLQIPNGDGDYNDVNVDVQWSYGAAIIDESSLPTDGDGQYSATVDISSAFSTTAAGDYGTDGAGTITYNLVLDLTNSGATVGSGLFILDANNTTAGEVGKGAEIQLVQNTDGSVSGMNGTEKIFTITVDNNGVLEIAYEDQLDPTNIWNPDTTNGDDAAALETAVANILVVTQTITDADGDSVTSDGLDVGNGNFFKIEDDGPVASLDDAAVTAAKLNNIELTVDESAGQQANPADNVSANSSSADFSILFSTIAVTGGGTSADYGTDGAGSVSYELSLSNTTTNTSLVTLGSGLYALDTSDTVTTDGDGYGQGSEIVMSVNANGEIEGKVGNEVYFTLSTDDSGTVTFTQSKNIWNSDTSDNNDVESLVLAKLDNADVSILLTQTVTDADGDKDSASVSLVSSDDSVDVAKFNILDDGPTVDVTSNPEIKTLLLEESFENFRTSDGWHIEHGGGDINGQDNSTDTTITGDHGVVWNLNSDGVEIQQNIVTTSDDGSSHAELDPHSFDGQDGNTVMSTTVTLIDSDRYELSFAYQPRPNAEDSSDMKVTFGGKELTIDSDSNGNLTITANPDDNTIQYTTTSDANGWTTISVVYSGITGTSTDLTFEGLATSDKLGALIDDISLSGVSGGVEPTLVVDETNLNIDDAADFSGLFSVTKNAGTDGEQEHDIDYTLAVKSDDVDSGLIDSASGENVLLKVDSGEVVGYVTIAGVETTVFTVSVDNTGKVTLDQERAVVHSDTTDPDENVSLLSDDLITLTRTDTLTDGDGDKVQDSDSINIGANLTFKDDAPEANDDNTTTLVEDGTQTTVSGQVLTNDESGADAPKTFVKWDASNAAEIAELETYGTLTLNTDGTYEFVLDNSLAKVQALDAADLKTFTFDYTMKDADGDTDTATLTVKIQGQTDDKPDVEVVDYVTGIDVIDQEVEEATGATVNGVINFEVGAGVDTLTIKGQDVTTVDSTDSLTYVTIPGTEGTLVVTGYDATTGKITYKYTEDGNAETHNVANDNINDNFAVEIKDIAGETAKDSLDIRITDTNPDAQDDPETTLVEDGTQTTVSGQVLDNDSATDAPKTFVKWDANNAAEIAELETYGTLTLNTDGTYEFVLDNSLAKVQALDAADLKTFTFDYTMKDADGDTDTATLTVKIQGQTDDKPDVEVVDYVTGIDVIDQEVEEATGATVNGVINFEVGAGVDTLTIKGQDVTTVDSTDSLTYVTIPGIEGTLVVTGYDATTGKITYKYTEDGNAETHNVANDNINDNFAVEIKDIAGETAKDSLDIRITDTNPDAQDDPETTLVEDGTQTTVSGQVLDNDSATDAPKTFVKWDASNAAEIAELETYGTLTLNTDGTYEFVLDNSLAKVQALDAADLKTFTFDYTMKDADGDTDTATLTVKIQGQTDDKPDVEVVDYVTGIDVIDQEVEEATGATVNGVINFEVGAGVDTLTIKGQDVTTVDSTDSLTYVTIPGTEGTLVVTGYDATTGKITYKYTEDGNAETHNVANDNINDNFAVEIKDIAGETAKDSLDIRITDTNPDAQDDPETTLVEDGTQTTVSGQVLDNDSATDAPKTFVKWDANNAAEIAELETYGTLTLNADGTYEFVLDNSLAKVQALDAADLKTFTFDYTMKDADGDTDTATLTVKIQGQTDDKPDVEVVDYVTGIDVIDQEVEEATGATVNGVINFEVGAGVDTLTIKGQDVTTVDSTDSLTYVTIPGTEGTLVVTGYDATTGKITYKYTEDGNAETHNVANDNINDNFAVEIKDIAGETAKDSLDIRITDTNPDAQDDPETTLVEDGTQTTVSGQVLDNDSATDAPKTFVKWDANNAAEIAELETYGTLTLNADGTYEFVLDNSLAKVQALDAADLKTFTFDYTMKDADGDTDTATLTVKIKGVSDTPIITLTGSEEREITTGTATEEKVTGKVTASIDKVQSEDLTVTLSSGDVITIVAGTLEGSVEIDTSRVDDAYKQGTTSETVSIASTSNSNIDITNKIATIKINDDVDPIDVTITAVATSPKIIDVTTVTDETTGVKVTAIGSNDEIMDLSVISGTNHDGFGVKTINDNGKSVNKSNGDTKELGVDEKIIVEFDNDVNSLDVSFAWRNNHETAEVTFYNDGVVIGSATVTGNGVSTTEAFVTYYDATGAEIKVVNARGSSDKVDESFTFELPDADGNVLSFDKVEFSAPEYEDDYLINQIVYTEVVDSSITDIETTGGSVTFNIQIDENYPPKSDAKAIVEIDGTEYEVEINATGRGTVTLDASTLSDLSNVKIEVIEIIGGNYEKVNTSTETFDFSASLISENDDISTIEDTAYTLLVTDFGAYSTNVTEFKITELPNNGTLFLNVEIGDTIIDENGILTTATEASKIEIEANGVISLVDVAAGKVVFEPNANSDEDGSFKFAVGDGVGNFSEEYTTEVEVVAVADVPEANIDVTKTYSSESSSDLIIKSASNTYNITDIINSSGSYSEVYNIGNSSYSPEANIIVNENINENDYLKTSNDDNIIVINGDMQDNSKIESMKGNDFIAILGDLNNSSQATLEDSEGIDILYLNNDSSYYSWDGVNHTENNTGTGMDGTIIQYSDEAHTNQIGILHINNIEGIVFSDGVTLGNIEKIEESIITESYEIDISAALTDLDGSETLTVIISNVPTGAVLTSDVYTLIDNGDNTWSVEIADAKSITDTLKMTVPAGTDDVDLTITARATETNDNTDGQNYEESSDQDSVVYAHSEINTLEIGSSTTNLLFTLDVSGSMRSSSTDSDGVTSTRFEVAKASIISTINAYAANGETEVNITLFNTGSDNFGWMTTSSALAFLNSLTMNSNGYIRLDGNSMDDLTGNRTDYFDALNETMTVDFTGHDADNTVAYFLSDGEPNDNKYKINDDNDQTIKDWKTYVETNIDKLNVVAISSSADVDPLEVVQVQDGDEVLVVKDVSTLGDVLLSTVTTSISGNVLDNVDFNSDGAGGLVSIKVGSIVYTDSFTDLDTPEGGKLSFDITDGSYTYTANSSDFTSDNQETFEVIASDSDGDTTNFGLTIKIDVEPTATENIIDLDDTDTIDLSSFIANNATTPVDGVDMENGSINNLNIDLDDIVDLDDADSELKIFGDSGDKVTLEGGDSNWTNTGKTEIDGDVFNVYEGINGTSNIKVLIDDDVSIEPDL